MKNQKFLIFFVLWKRIGAKERIGVNLQNKKLYILYVNSKSLYINGKNLCVNCKNLYVKSKNLIERLQYHVGIWGAE